MSDENKEKEAKEKAFKIITDIQADVTRHQAAIEKNNETLADMAKKLDGNEYIDTAEWKAKFEKMEADLEAVDETLKKAAHKPAMEIDPESKGKLQADLYCKNLRYMALSMCRSDQAGKFQLTNDQAEILGEKSFIPGRGEVHFDSNGWEQQQKAAMTTQNIPRAGALVAMPEMLLEIINQSVNEFSPMRQVSRKITTNSNQVEIPSKTARGVSQWVGETTTRSEDTTLTYGTEKIPLHEMAIMFYVSQTMLEDSAFNLEQELVREYSEAQMVLEGTAFTAGTGANKPQGIMSHASLSTRNQGEASTLTNGDALTQIPFDLKAPYMRNPVWQMRRATMGQIATLKGGDGQYLLAPLGQTTSYVLRGYPVLANPDMAAIAANAYPVVFGDFAQAYAVVDKVISDILIVDPYSSKTTGIVEFLMRKRVGGQAVNIEAVKALKIAV